MVPLSWGQKEEKMGEVNMEKGREEPAESMNDGERNVSQRWEADGGQIMHGYAGPMEDCE